MLKQCEIHGGYNNQDDRCLFCDYRKLSYAECPYCEVNVSFYKQGEVKDIKVIRKCRRHKDV